MVDVIYTFLFHIPIVFVVYVNLRLLIPCFLQKKKYIIYFPCVLVLVSIGILLNIATFNKLADLIFPDYYFIDYYEFTDILEFIFSFLLITSLLKYSKSWFKHLELSQTISLLEKAKLDAEINALKGQINPHFLFNSLNNLYSLSLDNDKRVPSIILRLSGMMRYLLYDTNVEKVRLEKELEHLKNFIEMQALRLGDQAKINISIENRTEHIQIAPLLFLPLVENAFKHGAKDYTEGAFVNISMAIDENEIRFKVGNKKGEVDEIMSKNKGGVGLNNLRKRLQLSYPNRHELIITETIQTFTAILKITLL